jgi:hypothetical protein
MYASRLGRVLLIVALAASALAFSFVPVRATPIGTNQPAYLMGAVEWQQLPACDGAVPFPLDISIEPPADDVAPGLAMFSGVWHGSLSQQAGLAIEGMATAAQLAVVQLDNRSARVVLGWGGSAWSSPNFEQLLLQSQANGRLASASGNTTLILEPDGQSITGRLLRSNRAEGSGTQPMGGVTTTINLRRCRLIQATPAEGPGRILLRDDFSTTTSNWPRESSDPTRRRLGYQAGEYVVVRVQGAGSAQGATGSRRFADALIEVDARVAEPTENAYVALQFRRQDDGAGAYIFHVDSNPGEFRVLRWQDRRETVLVGWTAHPSVQRGAAWNHLGIRAEGPELRFYVNQEEVARIEDAAFPEGRLYLGAASRRDGTAEVHYDNLLVSAVR